MYVLKLYGHPHSVSCSERLSLVASFGMSEIKWLQRHERQCTTKVLHLLKFIIYQILFQLFLSESHLHSGCLCQ